MTTKATHPRWHPNRKHAKRTVLCISVDESVARRGRHLAKVARQSFSEWVSSQINTVWSMPKA